MSEMMAIGDPSDEKLQSLLLSPHSYMRCLEDCLDYLVVRLQREMVENSWTMDIDEANGTWMSSGKVADWFCAAFGSFVKQAFGLLSLPVSSNVKKSMTAHFCGCLNAVVRADSVKHLAEKLQNTFRILPFDDSCLMLIADFNHAGPCGFDESGLRLENVTAVDICLFKKQGTKCSIRGSGPGTLNNMRENMPHCLTGDAESIESFFRIIFFHQAAALGNLKYLRLEPVAVKSRNRKPSDFQECFTELLYKVLLRLCPGFIDAILDSKFVYSESLNDVEARSNIADEIFWKAFRCQRPVSRPPRILLVSDLGLETEYTISEFSEAIISCFDDFVTPEIAYLSVEKKPGTSEPGSRIAVTSASYARQKVDAGYHMCSFCGRFVKSSNSGLEWHMKHVHGAATHAESFESVKKSVSAIALFSPANCFPSSSQAKLLVAHRDDILSGKSNNPKGLRSTGSNFLDACRDGNFALVQDLITSKTIDPSLEKDRNGSSGLLWAAGSGHLDICRFLVSHGGVNPTLDIQYARRGYNGRHALHWASRNNHIHIVRWLVVETNMPIDKPAQDGTTALCLAAWQGHTALVKTMVEKYSANPEAPNQYGCVPIMWAAQGGSIDVCQYFYGLGVKLNLLNHNGQGCLHKAAQRGSIELCKWLVEHTDIDLSLHMTPNADEKSTPSQLATFANNCHLAVYLGQLEANLVKMDKRQSAKKRIGQTFDS